MPSTSLITESNRRWWILVAMGTSGGLILLDETVVSVALPTIRGDLGTEMTENLVHGSDGNESAEREIGIFFPGLG